MNELLFLLLILACPLSMLLMMRGMHGGGHGHDGGGTVVDTTAKDARIARLEREVEELRRASADADREAAGAQR